MSLSDVIPRRPSDPALDYESIRVEALRFIQQVSGDVWTDYNEHDPGVTILEQFSYALTELSYRAGFPVKDLLAGPDGRIDMRRQALYVPRRILPGDPVTANDFRKLLVDRVPGLGNAWFEPWRPDKPDAACLPVAPSLAEPESGGTSKADARWVDGLYHVLLYAPATDPCVCECAPPDPLIRQALSVYARHRGLCEDVHRITVLRPARTVVHATVVIDGVDAPEAIMAELLYRAGQFLAPELRRTPLTDLIAAGRPPSEIFEGPLMRNGFIEDAELACRAEQIHCAQLVKAMASCPGVLSVNEVTVRVGRKTYGVSDAIQVQPGEILRLDPGFELKFLPLRLVRQGSFCRPDRERVRQEVARRWRTRRRTYPLSRDYEHTFALPRGRHRDLAKYSSVQAQFPATYGIGPSGLPPDAPPLRRAQAKQLKGYLLVFEQLLADYLGQLSRAKDLLSIEPNLDRSYFGQSLAEAIPDADELLHDSAAIDRVRRANDPWVERRNRFLDLLLALYAEELPGEMPGHRGNGTNAEEGGEKLIEAKLGLLCRLAPATRGRGRGFDYLAQRSARNVAGIEIRSRLQLGMDPDASASPTAADDRQLYIVEHVLLRAGRRLRDAATAGDGFDYGLTVSAVVCVPDAEREDPGFRRQVATLLRVNAPAHIAVVTRFIEPHRASSFKALHAAWCEALRARDPRPIVQRSVQMRELLVQCPAEPDAAATAYGDGGDPS
jgi:hypothetical protein